MAYVPGNNVLQVELRGLLFFQDVECTLYFHRNDTIEPTEVTTLLTWLESVLIVALKPWATPDMVWDEIYATDLTTSTSPTYSRIISPVIPGTKSGAAMPGSVAACISFRSNNRGRSGRGRNYFPGLSEVDVTGDNISITTLNALVAAYELCLGGGTFPSGWEWVLFSRISEGAFRTAGLAQRTIDVLSTDLTVDSQRGRLR